MRYNESIAQHNTRNNKHSKRKSFKIFQKMSGISLLTVEAIARGISLHNHANGKEKTSANRSEFADLVGFLRLGLQSCERHMAIGENFGYAEGRVDAEEAEEALLILKNALLASKNEAQTVETTSGDKQENQPTDVKNDTEDQTSVSPVVNPAELEA